MTDQVAGLTMSVDVRSVDNASKSLQNFRDANNEAKAAVNGFVDAEKVLKQQAKDTAAEAQRQQRAFEGIASAIDPTISKMARLQKAAAELDKQWKKGGVPDSEFFRLGEVLETQMTDLIRVRNNMTEAGRAQTAADKEQARQAIATAREREKEITAAARREEAAATKAAREKAKAEAEAERTRQRTLATQKAFITGLQQEVEGLGKTRAELLEIKAAQMGVSAQAAPLIAQLKNQTGQLKLAGVSAGQYKQAMRMLPAQITDVVTSLASGMPVWMVAIQQGGQIKDSFGGIGNTFKVLLAAISPVVVAVGTVVTVLAALAIGAYNAASRNAELAQNLILTGNYAASSADQIRAMTDEISANSLATGRTVQSIAASMVKAGKYTGDQIKKITELTANWSTVTGESADSIISNFDKITSDPVKGLLELNKTYNFLEEGQLTYINNLKKTKGESVAVAEATKLFADEMEKRIGKMAEASTPLEKMWRDIKKWASDAWDAIVQRTIGATNLWIDVIAGTVEQIQRVLKSGDVMISNFVVGAIETLQKIPGMSGVGDDIVKQQQKVIDGNKKVIADLDKSIAERNARVSKGEMGYVTPDPKKKGDPQYSQKTKDAVAEEGKELAKNNKEKKFSVDAGTKILDQYNADIVALQSQLMVLKEHRSVNDKISQSRKTLWNEQAKMQVLEQAAKERSLTEDEKEILAHKDQILQLAEKKAQIDDQIVAQTQLNARMDEATKYINQQISATEALRSSRSKSTREQSRDADFAKMAADWEAKGGNATGANGKPIDPEFIKMMDARKQYYAEDDAKRADWLAGAEHAFADWGDAATDMYANVGQVASAALDGLSSQLTDFLTTGQANFADFAKSIIDMIVKMITQMIIFNAISGATGGSTFTLASAFGGKANGGVVGPSYAVGGYTGDGGKYQPVGTVHAGEFVFTKEATKRLGVRNLYRLMRGYANGGSVNASGAVAGGGGGGYNFNIGDVNVDVNNGNDPKGLEAGVRAIFANEIQKACSQGGAVYNYINSKVG